MTARSDVRSEGRPQVLKAAIWMIGSITCFSAMAVAGRQVQSTLNTFELMTWRSVIGLVVVLLTGALTGSLGVIRARHMGLHFIRNICHFGGQNLWFWALTMIPLAQVFALEFTSPLWVTVLAPVLLSERLSRHRVIAALAGFAGILIVARPDLSHLNPGILAAATAAIGFAGSALFTKMLTRTEAVLSILFWMTVMQTIFGILCAFLWAGHLTLPDAATAPWLLVIGISGLVAHFCLTNALRVAPASIVIPIDFTRLPVIAVVGMILYHEPLDIFVFLGGAVILGANIFNIRMETK